MDDIIPVKVVLVGDPGVGKTCIIQRYVNNSYSEVNESTISSTYTNKVLEFKEYDKKLSLDIWDTAGQELYRALAKNFYLNAAIGILVYDIRRKDSFEAIKNYWVDQMKESGEEDMILGIAGNKCDLFTEEEVPEEEVKKYAQSIVDEAVCHEIVEIKEMCDLLQAHLIVCILPDCGDKAVISENEWRFCLYDELQKIGDANSKYYSLDATWEKVRVDLQQKGIICCDIAATLRYYMGGEIFIDYIHFGPDGNQLIAAELAGYINEIEHPKTNRIEKIESVKENYEKIICERRGDLNSNFFDNDKFQSFISMLRKNAADKVGKGAVIVMNANPFTKGHLYILEQALKLVDYLFVLVVQESETVIPFEDRLMLVQQNTEHLENLIIIPSSEYVVSTVTLPEYFKKEKNQLLPVDASRDIRIFTEFVMPALNVRMRIAGEEPYCRVTREYNRQIKERFEHENLEFVLIERLKADGEFISASRVRKALKDNDLDKIRGLVPDATYNYLVNSREMLIERINRLEVGKE